MVRKQKVKLPKEQRPFTEWTRPELADYIREKTSRANEIIQLAKEHMEESGEPWNETMHNLIEKMQKAGNSKTYDDMLLRHGNVARKRKAELLLQARQITEFERYLDNPTKPRGEKFQSAYQTFNRNYGAGQLTEDEYADIVDIFGVSGDYFSTFGYEDFIGLVTDVVQDGDVSPREFVHTITDLVRDIKTGKTDIVTSQDAIDELVSRLGM